MTLFLKCQTLPPLQEVSDTSAASGSVRHFFREVGG